MIDAMFDARRLRKITRKFGGRAFIECDDSGTLRINWCGRAGKAREACGFTRCFSEREIACQRCNPFDEFEMYLDEYIRRFDQDAPRNSAPPSSE